MFTLEKKGLCINSDVYCWLTTVFNQAIDTSAHDVQILILY